MMQKTAKLLTELASREAIRDCLSLYCRALDRSDEALLRAPFWPDARIMLEDSSVSVDQFVAGTMRSLRENMDGVMHIVTNILINLQDRSAGVESYSYGYHCYVGDGARHDVIMTGRYLDRFESRDDEWRILQRTVLVEWFRVYPDSGDWAAPPMGLKVQRGTRDEHDKSYALLQPG
jgi:hypothetical protein